jgi:hypothetical protein
LESVWANIGGLKSLKNNNLLLFQRLSGKLTCFYPKSWERQRVQKGMHAAPGRQVSTWAHAVKAEEVSRVGGSLCILSSSA